MKHEKALARAPPKRRQLVISRNKNVISENCEIANLKFFWRKKMQENDIQLLSAKSLAKKLSLSARTVWRLRSAGKLPKTVSVGSSIRWPVSDIQEWLRLKCPDMKTFEILRGGGNDD